MSMSNELYTIIIPNNNITFYSTVQHTYLSRLIIQKNIKF